jgi:NADP+-dependent farnesol dehydrogenase
VQCPIWQFFVVPLLLLLLLLLLIQELEGSLQSAPGKLYALKCDVTKEQDIKEAFKWVKDSLGGVDILVNNAGGERINTLCGNSDITLFTLTCCVSSHSHIMENI